MGSLAVVDATGRLLAHVGDIDTPVFTRSSIKPFQAMPLVAHWSRQYALEDADIALLCASHSGEPSHVQRVTWLLSMAHASERDLACGSHTPFFYAATGETPPSNDVFSRLQHNCSGKHTGMLMMAHAMGLPLPSYLDPDQPVQQAITASISHFCDVPQDQLVYGVDGCSAPNYALPLKNLALGAARLTVSEPDPVYGNAPMRIAQAMTRHPDMVSGQGRNDLALMRAGRGDWVSKVGADGVQVLASFSRRAAIAAKCSDGLLPPLMVALVSALSDLGWCDHDQRELLGILQPPPMRNAAGLEVGEMRAVLKLQTGG